nr:MULTISPECIES: NAD(P)-dependent alcohol dehydrogenase [unclassified Oleiphilus]
MKALVVENKSISLKEGLRLPKTKGNELLVKVVCASVNQLDAENIQGKYDFLLKILGSNYPVKTGIEFSGIVVEGCGKFKQGNKVFGYVNLMKGVKAHQEYISVSEDYIALIPDGLSFEQSAALPLGALTSLVALRDIGGLTQGSRVLINGASGGLGVYAIQLAKIFGASVTAIAGAEQETFLNSLGADKVINYHEQPIESLTETFDVLLDLSNQKLFKEIKHLLKAKGRFIPAEPNKHLLNIVASFFTAKKTNYLMVDRGDHEQLTQISE